jgi:hypothetical protein
MLKQALSTSIRRFFGLNPYPIPEPKVFFLHKVRQSQVKKDLMPRITIDFERLNRHHTPGIGEITLDAESNMFRVHDGVTPGGVVIKDQSPIEKPLTDQASAQSSPEEVDFSEIGNAPINCVIAYDRDKDRFIWKVRPTHWFSNEIASIAWNNSYAGYYVGETGMLTISGKGVQYRLNRGRVKALFLINKHADNVYFPTIKALAVSWGKR